MMPCYNARETLPWALASLVAQTFPDWELVLVDDGSTDNPHEVVEQANDRRIHYIRLPENRGRGYARQVALENCAGEFLCILDADDWVYPEKLAWQIAAMREHPEIVLVGTGIAVADVNGDIVGVRSKGESRAVLGPVTTLGPSPVAHGPIMMRLEEARKHAYDERLLHGQDTDFMLRLLMDRRYMVLPVVSYVYSEYASVTEAKILRTLRYTRMMYAKHRERFPVASRVNIGKSLAKEVVYRAGFALGQRERFLRNRSVAPDTEEIAQFEAARRVVGQVVADTFGATSDHVEIAR